MKKICLLAFLFMPLANASQYDQYHVSLKVHDQNKKELISEYRTQMIGDGRVGNLDSISYAVATCNESGSSLKAKKFISGHRVDYLFDHEVSSVKITQFDIDDREYDFIDGEVCQNTTGPIQLETESIFSFETADSVSKTLELKNGNIATLVVEKYK